MSKFGGSTRQVRAARTAYCRWPRTCSEAWEPSVLGGPIEKHDFHVHCVRSPTALRLRLHLEHAAWTCISTPARKTSSGFGGSPIASSRVAKLQWSRLSLCPSNQALHILLIAHNTSGSQSLFWCLTSISNAQSQWAGNCPKKMPSSRIEPRDAGSTS